MSSFKDFRIILNHSKFCHAEFPCGVSNNPSTIQFLLASPLTVIFPDSVSAKVTMTFALDGSQVSWLGCSKEQGLTEHTMWLPVTHVRELN